MPKFVIERQYLVPTKAKYMSRKSHRNRKSPSSGMCKIKINNRKIVAEI